MKERALVSTVHITHISLRIYPNEFAVGKGARTNVQLFDRVSEVACFVSALKSLNDTIANLSASLVCALCFFLHNLNLLHSISCKVVFTRLQRVNKLAELSLRVIEGAISIADKKTVFAVLTFDNVQFV